MIRLSRKSMISGKDNVMELPIEEYMYKICLEKYQGGALIQDAFPMLSDEHREFIKTGITPEEWNAIFPKEEEDTDDVNSPWDGDYSY